MGKSGITILTDAKQFQKLNETYFGNSPVWSIFSGNSGITILTYPNNFKDEMEYILGAHQFDQFI